ncbi:MAG: hypothetical protein KJ749_10835, partial [Planctomycetes bacterium]|nr:hypothetical protein [Planctomycetota bacterium]
HFMFRMGDADCRVAAARTLQIPSGADAIIPALEPGECLAKTPYWPHAVLCQVDFVPPCRDVHPQYDANRHVPAERLTEMPVLSVAAKSKKTEHRQTEKRHAEAKHAELRSEARDLLYQGSMHPYWPVARLYDLIGIPTPRMQNAIRKELETAGYAAFAETRMASKNLLLIELLEPAWRLLGAPPVPLRGRGKLVHRTFANWLRMVGEKRGYDSFCEDVVPGTNGHAADAAWKTNDGWSVFEIVVTSHENVNSHLESVLLTPGSPVREATIVAPQKSMLRALRAEVHKCQSLACVLDSISFAPVEQFEKELWP